MACTLPMTPGAPSGDSSRMCPFEFAGFPAELLINTWLDGNCDQKRSVITTDLV